MALLKRKSKDDSSGGTEGSMPEASTPHGAPPQEAPTARGSDPPHIGGGLERKWEEAWRRARAR